MSRTHHNRDSVGMNWSPENSDDATRQLSSAIARQVARAHEALSAENDLASTVHEARRAIKRARALLRLADPWPKNSATDSNLRDASRALAPLRDADVMVLTARGIRDGASASRPSGSGPDMAPSGPDVAPPTLLEALEEERGRHFAESGSADGPLSKAGELLRSVVVEIRATPTPEAMTGPEPTEAGGVGPTPSGGMELVQLGLGASYAAVRARSDPATGVGPVDERSHKLRKRVKDLRYQLEFLNTGHPKLSRLVSDLHHLTDLLGDANDLATLSRYTASANVLSETERVALTAHLEGGKLALQSEATALSARLFEEDPDTFVRQIAVCVTAPQGSPQG